MQVKDFGRTVPAGEAGATARRGAAAHPSLAEASPHRPALTDGDKSTWSDVRCESQI
jgi:hypothetical protein